ncbi:MAG TPA: carboxypeptidase regulatory-like domain-containing protein [Candidatus Dormibacteraeota bacterium]|nr:carboxypeptidase regulatory-like domain-containing protein [Candidatus Dormibacteraeota bacterium]
MKYGRLVSLVVLVAASAFGLFAQTFTATVSGTVTDPHGAAVAGATVTVTNLSTGVSKTATTDPNGSYIVPLLQPSEYTVTAESAGFEKVARTGIRLEVNQTAEINLQLALGGVNQTVEVSGITPLLVTQQSSIDQTIEQKFIEDLPLADQDIFQFVQLAPGVVSGNPNNPSPIGDIGNRNFFDSNFSVNGGKGSTNDVLLDGVANVIGDFNGVGTVPPVGSVQEFKVQSGAYSAEFGRSGGGNINIITKSGGSQYHGTVYEYLQNSALNANGWNRKPVANGRNHFGVSFSGPVWIPKVYNGKQKTFFFFDYEGRRNRDPFNPSNPFFTVPTPEQRRGDFSQTTNKDGQLIKIYNPWTTSPNPAGGFLRKEFPGNKIDCAAINPATNKPLCDPVALAALKFYPLPNRTASDLSGANNFIVTANNRLNKNLYSIRIDHNLSQRQSIFARYTRERREDRQANPFNNVASSGRVIIDKFTNIAINHVISITPNLINNARYGYTRAHANQIPFGTGFDPTSLGLPSYVRDNAVILQFPTFSPGGNVSISSLGSRGFNNQPRDTTTVADSVIKMWGQHTIKPGVEFRLIRFFPFQVFDTTGNYNFGTGYTQGPDPDVGTNNAGLGFASFLLGAQSSASFEYGTPVTIFHRYIAGYIQDDWRVSTRLTLNLGLRWDLETGTQETQGRLTTFDFSAPSPLAGKVSSFPDLKGLLRFDSAGEAEWVADKKRFAPRIGLAYKIGEKNTIRAGYGIFYLPISLENLGSVGFNYTIDSNQPDPRIPQVLLSNPFPSGIPPIIGKSQGALSLIGQGVTAVPGQITSSYNQLWNIAIQRQVGRDWLAEIAYVGSHGVHLPINSFNLSQLDPSMQSLGNTALNKSVNNPFFGIITDPLSPLSKKTVVQSQLLKPFPQYTSITYSRPLANFGKSSYNSMQIKLQKRFSNGLALLTHYTWSKDLDTGGVGSGIAFFDATPIQNIYNIADERSLSGQDVPHRFVFTATYELPIGRGKMIGADLPRALDVLIGGWQINGVYTKQSGTPLSIIAANRLGIGNARMRASVRPGVDPHFDVAAARNNVRQGANWFNTAAFYNPNDVPSIPGQDVSKQFVLGNVSRTLGSVRRDRYHNMDFSLFKGFQLSEQIRFQLRLEAFNFFNTVVFGTPETNVNSSQFGKITGQANTPRKVQVALRINF